MGIHLKVFIIYKNKFTVSTLDNMYIHHIKGGVIDGTQTNIDDYTGNRCQIKIKNNN